MEQSISISDLHRGRGLGG